MIETTLKFGIILLGAGIGIKGIKDYLTYEIQELF
jgi:hypothetical protein